MWTMALKVNQKGVLLAVIAAVFMAGFVYVGFTRLNGSQLEIPVDSRHQPDIASSRCVQYSPAYPSAGGGGCSPRCVSTGNTKNSSYYAIFYNSTHHWPNELIENMHKAGNILKKYGPLNSLNTERNVYLHVTFDYYCCYSPEEGKKIGAFVDSYEWTPREVWFDKLVCAIHRAGDLVSLVLMLNKDSQKEMLSYALKSESDFEHSTGLKKHISHTELQEFHMTLATVNQSQFPVKAAVDEINRTIPPQSWHSSPVVVHKPLCKRCGRV